MLKQRSTACGSATCASRITGSLVESSNISGQLVVVAAQHIRLALDGCLQPAYRDKPRSKEQEI